MPNSIEELTLMTHFNLELNNLPNGCKKIIFYNNSHFNKQLNCLPNSIEYIELNTYYKLKIDKFPLHLKKIKCSKQYKFINDLSNYNLTTY